MTFVNSKSNRVACLCTLGGGGGLTGLSTVGQTGPVALGVDGNHGDGVAGVGEELLQDGAGGALRYLLLQNRIGTTSEDVPMTEMPSAREGPPTTV